MRFFNNLSIGTKFLCSSLLIVGILTAISWQSIGTIQNCHHACGLLISGAFNTKSSAQSAQTSFYALAETANQALVYALAGNDSKSSELRRKFSSDAQALTDSLDGVLNALNADPLVDKSIIAGLVVQADRAKAALNAEYVPLINALISPRQYAGTSEPASADFMRSVEISEKIAGDIDGVFQGIAAAGDNVFNNYVAFLLATILKLKVFIIIAVIFSSLLVLILAFAIKKPFARMMGTLKEIATDWDVTKQFEIRGKDEVGRLAEFLNLTFEKLKDLLSVIKHMTVSLSHTGTDLTSSVQQTASSVNQIMASIQSMKEQIHNQAGEVQKTGDAMERIMSQVDNLNGHITEQSQSVSQSSAAIEQMLANIHSVAETLSRNEANVVSLAESSETGRRDLETVSTNIQEIAHESEGLLEINSVMQNIASQTNLLSMNAAIEAAHAGEAGKGFAVVADEIRKLAENSAEQSKMVSTVLKKIASSIEMITKSTGIVINEFETIAAEIDTVSNQESAVRTAMEEQETGSRSILEEITRLRNITDQVKTASSQIAAEQDEMKRQGLKLGQITAEINSGMDEAAIGTELISTAAGRVNEISDTNRYNIDTLITEIAKFKVEEGVGNAI
ncbi:methyl-accepting chemotaxis protein [Spirochaetia bacterium]|nr:methyl-accepting chemotaxis protein [Spirochaetia bacterium]